MVELLALQELTSRDHSARKTFLHTRRMFQGPGLPPSNAVHALPLPGDPPLPDNFYQAKRGHSTFVFRIPIPRYIPASINFVNGLAKVRYEVRGSVGVYWKGEKQLVTDKGEVGVLESFEEDSFDFGAGSKTKAEEGVVVVGENGRFWMHGRIIGGLLVAGESACVELQVKNHSSRKNANLVLSLNRTLILPTTSAKPLEISDTILTVPYRGQEYTLPPGAEGVAHLVFDVPTTARSVRGGMYDGDEDGVRNTSEALFSIQANVEVKVGMRLGSKDIKVDIPVTIVHPDALPDVPQAPPPPLSNPRYTATPAPAPQFDPQIQQVWIPHPQHQLLPMSYAYDQRYYPQHIQYPHQDPYTHLNLPQQSFYVPHRPSSAGPLASSSHTTTSYSSPISGLPIPATPQRLLPLPDHAPLSPIHPSPHPPANLSPSQKVQGIREEGQGAVASRISRHLRQSSVATGRGRSSSPVAHRFGHPELSMDALNASNTGDVGGGTADPLLHSPRPRMQHKQSYTTVSGKDATRSENVVELEKMAAGLSDDTPALSRRKGKEKVQIESTPKLPPSLPRDMNKTLPVPPPSTKSRESLDKKPDGVNTAVPLESSFTSPSLAAHLNAIALTESIDPHHHSAPAPNLLSPTDTHLPTPRTPTLVACKRPPKLDRGAGLGGNGLDALEQRLLAEVGTRKQEKEKKPDVRDILVSSFSATRDEVASTPTTGAVKGKNTGIRTGSGTPVSSGPTRSVLSTSTTPNPDARATGDGSASSERQDESAISSLTLDQSSVGENDDGGKQKREQELVQEGEKEKDREDEDQESMDGGKTHRAGKSVAGVESYFQSRNNHKRELAVVEPGPNMRSYSSNAVVDREASPREDKDGPIPEKKRTAPAALKRSAQARGRVAAWLGNIDPDVPPQEEIIPPSPSVVKPLGYEWDDEYIGGQSSEKELQKFSRRRGKSRSRSCSSSRSWSPPPIPRPTLPMSHQPTFSTTETEDKQRKVAEADVKPSTAVSPDPRSSGFMPIETMKAQRDSITKSMSRSMMRHFGSSRDMTVVLESRKVMDIWSEGLPRHESGLKEPVGKDEEEETKKMNPEYPLMEPVVPKAQAVGTDKKISPSVSTNRQDGSGSLGKVTETRGEQSITSRPKGKNPINELLTPPMSYANVASGAGRPTSPAVATNGGAKVVPPKLPVFPPLAKQDQEVKYDVKSARGGRGGKVTHVAALWAAVAAGTASSSGTGSGAGSGSGVTTPAVKVGGKGDVKLGAGGGTTVINRSQPNDTSNAKVNAKKKPGAPLLLPRRTTAASPSANASTTSTAQLNPHQLKLRPPPHSSSGSNSVSPLPQAGSKKPKPTSTKPGSGNHYNKSKNATIPLQMKKSTSVPASLSSSFATPMLSSTASLARPVGGVSNNGGKTAAIVVGLPGIGSGLVPGEERNVKKRKSGLDVVGEESSSSGGPDVKELSARASDSGAVKPENAGEMVQPTSREMAFGQARLRDLIKRYQS
ncbi:hypothetical protein Agabi119p4_5314 [Agaricus bisporus var. burnettii]|uniref:Arrestin C-terminal-like domain-containing protein n=1 Tax=Agaricus bisporus var. burnettii TaxID=192524 RepID=A0A8H7F1H1_AGABI|nr:hypothetical protein Agabi119p4_5314 [Agaricus bisporus var. burnettii]